MDWTDVNPDPEWVWRRWEARFVAAGVDWNIVQRLRAEIASWDQWCARWSAVGDELDAAADEAMERGRALTAADLWVLAGMLHHFGGMYFICDLDQMARAERRGVASFARAAPHLETPALPVSVDYRGTTIPGYLRVPDTPEPPPVVLFYNGFEGSKEESQRRAFEYLDRGMAVLSWDGPGRGETLEHLPMHGDQREITSLLIDMLERRDDVDATRIGATGPNRGAHTAAKAAAREPRIRALALVSPGYDRRDADWRNEYELRFFLHIFHVADEEALRERLRDTDLTLEGDAERITCPTLVVSGTKDFAWQASGTQRLYDELAGPRHWELIAGAEHTGNNVPYLIRPMLADHMASVFGAGSL